MHIVDRRLNPRGKSLENRQRFLRRAKALVQRAVKHSSQHRDIQDVLEGGEVSIPLDGMNEPRLRRGSGGVRDQVLPGNKKFVEGDMLPRSGEGGGRGAKARARTRSASFSPARSSSICSSMTWSCRTSRSGAWPRPSTRLRA